MPNVTAQWLRDCPWVFWQFCNRVITFDQTSVVTRNQKIHYNEVTDLRIHGVDQYRYSHYSGSYWTFIIASKRGRIWAQFSYKGGINPPHEILAKLCYQNIVPAICQRVAIQLQNPRARIPFGDMTLASDGIRRTTLWGRRHLPWEKYAGTSSQGGLVTIWVQGRDRKKVWSTHKITDSMVCAFSRVLDHCHRLLTNPLPKSAQQRPPQQKPVEQPIKQPQPVPVSKPDWYYLEDGQQRGPESLYVLKGHISAQHLPADILVWQAGMAEWTPANSLPAFKTEAPAPILNREDIKKSEQKYPDQPTEATPIEPKFFKVYPRRKTIAGIFVFSVGIFFGGIHFIKISFIHNTLLTLEGVPLGLVGTSIFNFLLGLVCFGLSLLSILSLFPGSKNKPSIILTQNSITFPKSTYSSENITVYYNNITSVQSVKLRRGEFVMLRYSGTHTQLFTNMFASRHDYLEFVETLTRLCRK